MTNILQEIKRFDTIIIHGHKRPDGDCYGGQYGLKGILKAAFPQKNIYVVGEESDYVKYVGTPDVITDDVYKDALSIVVDTATKDRISDMRYTLGKKVIKIDHHIDVDAYGDMNWVDTSYPAVSEMITDFAFQHKLEIPLESAIALYTGLITDTGRFRYRGVSKRTHTLAGLLIEAGVDVELIDSKLSKETLKMYALKGYVYSNFTTVEGGFIYLKMPRAVIEEYGVTDEEAASVVNLIGGLDGYPVWALMIEYENEIRIRLRSSGPMINTLAEKYEGGGHAKASGARLPSWEHVDQFSKDVIQHIKDSKE
ncbi:MAG: bifunctional oligoribonuclease/PAP phosphatase NrnA [Firmicutes bacterium]|nr:bifunctional oligoribonuclease/PAP phosphatase NrnA [Bacillota bacterium]